MACLFLMLLSVVGFIQDKRFFTSAPQDIQNAIQPRGERFPGAHLLGWCMMILAVLMTTGSIVYAGWDGIKNGFGFKQFFCRFLFMFLGLKAFDILFFDWVLLCHSGFFPYFYPEVKGLVGPHQFGFNRESHLIQILAFIALSALLAWLCISL